MNDNGNGIYILGAARTPIGKMMGGLASVPATELGATAIRAAIDRAHIDASTIDEVIMG
ncbi:MAG: acetyl-CoA C-acetyltransferase, partial [Chloroflexi bacterium]|nr:acetyl-CoA C-acetyltransferase [Chloroflexota bacterium]